VAKDPIDRVIEEIRVAMLRCGMTQRELAKQIDEPEHWVHRRLNKKVDLSVAELLRIADALEVSAGELLQNAAQRVTHKQPVRHAVALPSVRPVRGGPRRPVRLCPAPPLAA